MALIVSHAFVSSVTDSTAAADAGEVLPSNWNASHVISGELEPDNSTITASAGVISATTATTSQLGVVKPDGSTITIAGGVITAVGGSGAVSSVSGTAGLIDVSPTTGSVVVTADPAMYLAVATGNSFIGGAGNSSVSGSYNLGLGLDALLALTSGDENMAIGVSALQSNTNGPRNVGVGASAMQHLNGYTQNVAIGDQAMGQPGVYGDKNTAIGADALGSVQGSQSVGIGYNAGFYSAGGSHNVFIGDDTGFSIVTGSNNTILGGQCDTGSDVSGCIVIGTGDGTSQADYNLTASAAWTFNEPVYTKGAAQILGSKTTITGGSTGNVPTLTGGPVTGNPTKWLPYNDNGTIRYIPSW